MAKRRLTGSFSHFLYSVGNAIHFAPGTAFAPPKTEREEPEREKPFFASRLRIKHALAKMSEQSFVLGLYRSFLHGLLTTRVRALGVLFFSCGFLQIFSYFLSGYLPRLTGDENNLIFGVTLVFLALLCSFTRGDVKDVLKKSFFYRVFLEPLFGSSGWEFPTGRSTDRFFLMIPAGALLALFSVVFSPLSVLLSVLLAVLTAFIFYQPEAGLSAIALTLFAVPFRFTLLLTNLTLIAFLCKCAVGKRSLVFSWIDGLLPLLLSPLLFFGKVRLFFVLGALYFLSLGLLRTLESVRRLFRAAVLGSVFASVMILIRYGFTAFFSQFLYRYPNLDEFLYLDASEPILTCLVMICPVAVGLFRSEKRSVMLLLMPGTLLIYFAAVFCGGSPAVWIALLLALSVQNMMTDRFSLVWTVISGLALVIVLNVVPPVWVQKLFDFFRLDAFSVGSGEGGLSLLGVGSILGILIPVGLIVFFSYLVFCFCRHATRPEAFPRVLGAAMGVLAFVLLWIGGLAMDESAAVLLLLYTAIPRVSLLCAKREEIRLPY